MARGSANNITENRNRSKRNTPTQEIEEQTNAKETKPASRRKNAATSASKNGTKLSKKDNTLNVEESVETSFSENKMEAPKKSQPSKAVGRKRKVESLEETSKEPESNDALEKRSVRGLVKKIKADEMEDSSQNVEVSTAEEIDMSAIHDESSQSSNKSDTLRRTRSAKRNDDNSLKDQKETKNFKTKGKDIQFEIKTSIVDDASQDLNKPAKSGPAKKTRKAQQISENITVEEKESILDEVNQIVNADKFPVRDEVVDRNNQDLVKPVKLRNTRRSKKVEETNVKMGNEEVKDIELDNLAQDETDTAAVVKIVTRKTRNAKKIENDTTDDTSQDSVNIIKSESSRKTRRTKKTEGNIDADLKNIKAEDKHSSLTEADSEHVSKTNVITPDILDENSLDSVKSNQSGLTRSGTLRRTRNSERVIDKQNVHVEKAELCSSEDMESSSDANSLLKDENLTEGISVEEMTEKDSFNDLEQDEEEIKNASDFEDNMPGTKNLNKKQLENEEHGGKMQQSLGDISNATDEKCAEIKESDGCKYEIHDKESQNLKENLIDSSKSELLPEENDSVEDLKKESLNKGNELSESVESPIHKQESVISFKESNIPIDEHDSHQKSSLQISDECHINAEKIVSGNETDLQSSNQADLNNSDTNQSETEAMSIEESVVGSSENIDHKYSASAQKSEKANVDIDVCSDKTEEASVANFDLESSTTDSDTGNLVIEENFQNNVIEANSSGLPSIVVEGNDTVDNGKLNENMEDRSSVKIFISVSEPSVEKNTFVKDNGSKSLDSSSVEDAVLTSSNDEIPTVTDCETKDKIDNFSNENTNKLNILQTEHIDDLASTRESEKPKALQSGLTSEETGDNVATNSSKISETVIDEPKQELFTACRNSNENDSSPVETETPSLQGGNSSLNQLEIDSNYEDKNIDSVDTPKNKTRKKSSKKEESPDIEISKGGKRIITTYEVSSNVGDSAKGSLANDGDGRSEGSIGIKIKRKRIEEVESDHNLTPAASVSSEADIHEQTQQLFGNFQSEPGPSGTQQSARKSLRKRKQQDSDQETRENPAAPIRMYLEKFVPFLLEGLLKITYVRPADPIQYLADWMKDNKEAAYTSILKREQASEE
ncbi:hypothetical protein JTE90_026640 [Oedothorax gibbosus]|uniref:Uncharacterized protein n=1 Tax=Oedothorax gibbosus TaxID=931172 RepID=A0AAV6U9E0_9ARAC|nr:hypothetical protein JTE90_026640 [Oedothorax gibbosus]